MEMETKESAVVHLHLFRPLIADLNEGLRPRDRFPARFITIVREALRHPPVMGPSPSPSRIDMNSTSMIDPVHRLAFAPQVASS
jgi:hypothetical protein